MAKISLDQVGADLDELSNRIITLYSDGKELVAWAELNLTTDRLQAGDLVASQLPDNVPNYAPLSGPVAPATPEQLTAMLQRVGLLQTLVTIMESQQDGAPDTIVNIIRKTRTRFRG